MTTLDSPKAIEKFDKGKILASIRLLPDQFEQAWEETKKLDINKNFYKVENIVICGMGGSALGGRIVDSLMAQRVRTPVEVFTEYDIPYYVNQKTLVIATSYSGNTEETISALRNALRKKAQIFVITTGGKLGDLAKKENLTSYIYQPKANPSDQPRMGLGYSIGATLSILIHCSHIHMSDDDIYEMVTNTRKVIKEYDIDEPTSKNICKNLSIKLKNKIPVIVASDHLYGVAHSFKNQLNENSKVFSTTFDIPELNHHLMEGLKNPAKVRELLYFLFYKSKLYRRELEIRYDITADVVNKNGYQYTFYEPRSSTKMLQIFETLSFGSFVSFYLAALYGVDPSKIPWVDYFKEELAKY